MSAAIPDSTTVTRPQHQYEKSQFTVGPDELGSSLRPSRLQGTAISPTAAGKLNRADFFAERGESEDQIPVVLVAERDSARPPQVYMLGQRDEGEAQAQPEVFLVSQRQEEPPILIVGQRNEDSAKAAAAQGMPYLVLGKRDEQTVLIRGQRDAGEHLKEVPIVFTGKRENDDDDLQAQPHFLLSERDEQPVLIVGQRDNENEKYISQGQLSLDVVERDTQGVPIFFVGQQQPQSNQRRVLDEQSTSSHGTRLYEFGAMDARAFKIKDSWKKKMKKGLKDVGLRMADSAGMSFMMTQLQKVHDKDKPKQTTSKTTPSPAPGGTTKSSSGKRAEGAQGELFLGA